MDAFEVFHTYQVVRARVKCQALRMPKDFDTYFNSKLLPIHRENIRKMARYSITVWQNIDIEEYFKCGFEVFKTFYFDKFFDKRIIALYKDKMRIAKFAEKNLKQDLIDSAKYLKQKMHEFEIKTLEEYCKHSKGHFPIIFEDYLKNKVNAHLIVYCQMKKYISLKEDICYEYLSTIIDRYRDYRAEVSRNIEFLNKIEDILNE